MQPDEYTKNGIRFIEWSQGQIIHIFGRSCDRVAIAEAAHELEQKEFNVVTQQQGREYVLTAEKGVRNGR